jgi:hypothetical protein
MADRDGKDDDDNLEEEQEEWEEEKEEEVVVQIVGHEYDEMVSQDYLNIIIRRRYRQP